MNNLSDQFKKSIAIGLFSFLLFLVLLFFHNYVSIVPIAKGYKILGLWLGLLASVGITLFSKYLSTENLRSWKNYEIKQVLVPEEKDPDIAERESQFVTGLIPDVSFGKISGWDVSCYPSSLKNPKSDYIRILPTLDGFVGVLAGFPEIDNISTAQRLFFHGVVSATNRMPMKTEELQEHILTSLQDLTLKGAKLSLIGFGKNRDELLFHHFMEIPIFRFSAEGFTSIESHNSYEWEGSPDPSTYKGIELGDYVVLPNDRLLLELELSLMEIQKILHSAVMKSRPKNSKEMLISILSEIKSIVNSQVPKKPLEQFSIIVIRRKR